MPLKILERVQYLALIDIGGENDNGFIKQINGKGNKPDSC